MKDVPFEVAKQFCEDYKKDQVIILSCDKASQQTWVTTYGVGDENSIQACNAGIILKDYLKLRREEDEIPSRFKEFAIESVDRYYYLSSRNGKTYVETTFWYDKHTLERKETTRTECINDGEEYKLPEWARSITERRRSLESQLY